MFGAVDYDDVVGWEDAFWDEQDWFDRVEPPFDWWEDELPSPPDDRWFEECEPAVVVEPVWFAEFLDGWLDRYAGFVGG